MTEINDIEVRASGKDGKGNTFHLVRREDIIQVLKDRKKELKGYIKNKDTYEKNTPKLLQTEGFRSYEFRILGLIAEIDMFIGVDNI